MEIMSLSLMKAPKICFACKAKRIKFACNQIKKLFLLKMSSIVSSISGIDIFGIPVTLTACQREKFKSSFGGFLTLAVATLTILFSIKTSVECFARTSVSINSQTITLFDSGPLALNSSNFNFAIGYQNNQFPLNASLFGFEMLYISQARSDNGSIITNITTVPLVQCTLDYWKGYENEFKLYGLANSLCPSAPVYGISGNTATQNFQTVRLRAVECKNGTNASEVVCAPQNVINNVLSLSPPKIALYFTNNNFDYHNHSTPVSRSVVSLSWSVAPGLFTKMVDMSFAQQTIITEDNIFFSAEPNRNITYLINGQRSDISKPVTTGAQEIYLSMDFLKNPQIAVTTRVFSKIDSVLTTVGGVFSTLVAVFAVFGRAYNNYSRKVQIANSLYEFEYTKPSPRKDERKPCCKKRRRVNEKNDSKQSENKPHKKRSSDDKLHENKARSKDLDSSSLTALNGVDLGKEGDETSTKDQRRLVIESFCSYEKNFGKTLPLSVWQYVLKTLTCGRRKTDRLLAQADQRMQKEFDLTYVLKKLGEIDKLKEVLFSEDQLEVFCYARSPKITEEEISAPKVSAPKQKSSKQDLRDTKALRKFAILFKSYRKLLNQDNNFSKKLIQLMGPEMQNILYELNYNLRTDPALKALFYSELSVRAFEEIQARKRLTRQNLTRMNAMLLIKRGVQNFLKRRAKLKNTPNASIDLDNLPSFLIDSQK